ncbi:MAG: SiaC family regulatory phosphoprotein [Bacteroidota bacterium]
MINDTFTIIAQEDTPFVSLEKKEGHNQIVIKGLSMPENVLEFYAPLNDKIFSFFDGAFENIQLDINLEYMNSMSNKQLLKLLKNMAEKDNQLKVIWRYNEQDDLIKHKGAEIQSIFPHLNLQLEEIAN